MEGVLFDAEYLPILAETIGKGDRIWEITKKGIAGEIDWEQGLRTRVEELRGIPFEECKKIADSLPIYFSSNAFLCNLPYAIAFSNRFCQDRKIFSIK